jgi:hypothetical protein
VRAFLYRWARSFAARSRRAILALGICMPTSAKPKRPCPSGLDDRCRDEDGEIRQKRSDTLVATLREEYGDDFARGFRGDATLETVLSETDSESLGDYLRRRPAPGRPATARDTARVLGVPAGRADRLIKRSDALLGTLRKEYGDDFAPDFRSDAKLGTVLRETGSGPLSEFGEKKRVGTAHAKARATKTKAKTKTSASEARR